MSDVARAYFESCPVCGQKPGEVERLTAFIHTEQEAHNVRERQLVDEVERLHKRQQAFKRSMRDAQHRITSAAAQVERLRAERDTYAKALTTIANVPNTTSAGAIRMLVQDVLRDASQEQA